MFTYHISSIITMVYHAKKNIDVVIYIPTHIKQVGFVATNNLQGFSFRLPTAFCSYDVLSLQQDLSIIVICSIIMMVYYARFWNYFSKIPFWENFGFEKRKGPGSLKTQKAPGVIK